MENLLKVLYTKNNYTGIELSMQWNFNDLFNILFLREPQWSADEKLFCKTVNTDVVFYEDCNFEKIVARINCYKVASYKLSPNIGTYFVLCHTAGSPGQPSFGR